MLKSILAGAQVGRGRRGAHRGWFAMQLSAFHFLHRRQPGWAGPWLVWEGRAGTVNKKKLGLRLTRPAGGPARLCRGGALRPGSRQVPLVWVVGAGLVPVNI